MKRKERKEKKRNGMEVEEDIKVRKKGRKNDEIKNKKQNHKGEKRKRKTNND